MTIADVEILALFSALVLGFLVSLTSEVVDWLSERRRNREGGPSGG